jgi:putative ABC transport system permease protein
MWTNIKLALRILRGNPAFTAAAVASLTLGIGANTAIFSFVNSVLLTRLNVPGPERLVTFSETYRSETTGKVFKLNTIDQLAQRSRVFSGVFGRFAKPVSFSTGDAAQWVLADLVTGEYFETLQVKAAAGRLLTNADVRDAVATPVCVISYGLWQRAFAGDFAALGRTIFLNGHPYRLIGVTAKGFHGPELQHRFDLQIPATRIGDVMPAFGSATGVDWLKNLSWLSPMARLKPDISRIEAQEATRGLLREIQVENDPDHDPKNKEDLRLEDGSRGFGAMRSTFGRPILVLMSAAAVVLLIACANLANSLLARAQGRAREFAVRRSIGASRGQLLEQLFIESLLLALPGGVSGLLLSFWITRTLLAFLNVGRSAVSAIQVHPDARVLCFSLAISLTTALLFGVVPAWQITRTELLPGLKDEAFGGRFDRSLPRRILAITQIALSLVVVFAAGLLARTLRALETVDLGFKPHQVLSLNIDPSANAYSAADSSRILDEILRRIRLLPAVRAASLAASTPGGPTGISMSVDVPGSAHARPGHDIADFNFISPDYFETVSQPLLRGRDFTPRDNENSKRVAVVNQTFARHFFPGENPLGRTFRQGGGEIEIVGVAADSNAGARKGPDETVYLPEKQGQTSGLTLLVRPGGSPNELLPSLLAIVRSVDKRLPVVSAHTLDLEIEAGLSSERILGYLSSLFAALTTLLAGIGLYGVISYSIERRTREIGVRFAVGAQTSRVVLLFAREILVLLGIGLAAGAPLAIASGYAFKSLLFGLKAADPLTLAVSGSLLILAACLAVALPLRQAATMSPLAALRHE